jgi:hypothetical protein
VDLAGREPPADGQLAADESAAQLADQPSPSARLDGS